MSASSGLSASAIRAINAQVTMGAITGLQAMPLQALRLALAMTVASGLAVQLGSSVRAATVRMSAATEMLFNLTTIPLVYAYAHQVVRTDPIGRAGRSTTGMVVATRRPAPGVVKTTPGGPVIRTPTGGGITTTPSP
jgi:hypothetical protein